MAKTFKWDAAALERSQTEPIDLLGNGETVVFYELPRSVTMDFIKEAQDVRLLKPGKVKEYVKDDDGNETEAFTEKDGEVRMSLDEIEEKQRRFVAKYLSLSTKGTYDGTPSHTEDYFIDSPLTANQFGQLVRLIFELNHVDDILSAGGNWLLLPTIYRVADLEAAI